MLKELPELIAKSQTINYIGKIENVTGMAMEASANNSRIGDLVLIYNEKQKREIPAEVVGFHGDKVQLMAYENLSGIGSGSFVRNTGRRLKIPVGEFLRGRIIDALGHPLDNKGENTIGKGQRIGIFAGSGVGKSTLMGMIARNVTADINVIALVGERGREVLEFAERDLGPEGMKRSVLVVATSDQPAMLRMKCPMVATTIAEYFKNQGYDVLLMMDSLTRFAMAHREIGLATGEPPVARGYTPSIYAEFPKLLERCGNFANGSITGVYTVLVEGDDTNEPISDMVRGILDGHIVLSRKLANSNHFPAIDINASISRLMATIAAPEHKKLAGDLRDLYSLYSQNEDLISIGAYKSGTNHRLDYAISKIDKINTFLKQKVEESFSFDEIVEELKKIFED